MRIYNKCSGNKKSTNIISFLILILVFSFTFCWAFGNGVHTFINNSAAALTSANVDNAYKAGGGEEMWSGTNFNFKVVKDLYDKLFGKEDPIEYIKANGAGEFSATGSYIVPASTINSKIGRTNDGMIINLGGIYWMAVSLTVATIDGKENAILTLYQANAHENSSVGFVSSSSDKGTNMYARSLLRQNILYSDDFSNYRLFSDGSNVNSFAAKYLVQPKYIKYQETETQAGRANPFYGNINLSNDAYGNLTSNWYLSNHYVPSDTYVAPNGTSVRYDAWKEDYIWIPSATETGWTNYLNGSSIWKLSTNQLAHTASQGCSWLRSGGAGDFYNLQCMSTNGSSAYNHVNATCSVRSAIHFNITAAYSGGVILDDPQNVPTTYNGDVQTVKSVVDAKPTENTWYDSEWYEHTGNYVNLTYQNSKGTTVTDVKDAGEYWVKAEITQAWIDAVNKEVDIEGANNSWTPTEIDDAKKSRKPKFDGTPDTSDAAHVETDTVRWFKFIINPKELTVNAPTYDSSSGTFTAPTFADETELYSDAPAIGTRFTGTIAAGGTFDKIDEMPSRRGTYTAQAILVNSATDKTEYKGNYVIKDASSKTCTIVINRNRLNIPQASEGSKAYTGDKVKFILSGYTAEWQDIATLTASEGAQIVQESDGGWYIVVAKNAGTYRVTAAIKSENKSDWCWNTSNYSDEIIADQTITVTVTPKTLYVDFISSTGAFFMQNGDNVTFKAEPSNAVEGDDVVITLQYYNVRNSNAKIDVPSGILDASTIEDAGSFKLVATLDPNKAEVNKNYVLDPTGAEQEFMISAQGIEIDSVDWQYRENNGEIKAVTGGASSSSPFDVTYTGGTFVFSLATNAAGLAAKGVKVDTSFGVGGYLNSSQLNATPSAVAVTVRLIPLNEGFSFNDASGRPLAQQYKEFTVYVRVRRANIDLSQVKWSADALEFNEHMQSVSIISGLPSFLAVSYSDGAKATAVGSYRAEVSGFTTKAGDEYRVEAANYNIPSYNEIISSEYLKHDWQITKKRIDVIWISVEETSDSTVVYVPYLSDNSGAVAYTFYDRTDTERANPLTLEDIFDRYDPTQRIGYLVVATVINGNYVLIENDSEVTESTNGFEVGDNKIPVKVRLENDSVVYNGTKQLAVVVLTTAEGINVEWDETYYVQDESGQFVLMTDPDQPLDAGVYKIVVSLKPGAAEEMAISGQREFIYTIEKAEIDLSGLKWVDTEHDNAEYTAPFVYMPGVSHTLALIGTDDLATLGLSVDYDPDTLANRTGKNAKDYRIVVKFTENEFFESNYKVPDDIEFVWQILPYTPDLSGVKWNYNAEPFVFKIVNGVPVKQSARLIGFPEEYAEELASLIIYGDDDGEYSDVSIHRTSFTVDEANELRANYGDFVFSGGLESVIDWEIHPLRVEKPQQRQEVDFVVDGYSFGTVTNLPDDFAEYFDVKVLDANGDEIPPTDGSWTFVNVGRYIVQIRFKQGMNKSSGGTVDNVKWADNSRSAYQLSLTINKLVFTVNGWIKGEGTDKPTLDADNIAEIEKYFEYVLKRVSDGAILPIDSALEEGTAYTIALKLRAGIASGNVAIKYADVEDELEETPPYTFITEDSMSFPPESFYDRPAEGQLLQYPYTGKEITFNLEDLDWFVPSEMQVISGDLTGTEIGEYTVMVGFKASSLYAWGSADEWDRLPVTVKIVIYEDEQKGRFILTEAAAASHGYKFLYENFHAYENDISEYVYSAESVVYIANLAYADTVADLLRQFANAEDITAYTADNTLIEDLTTMLATGMMLRIMDGETILNQLTISVMGDIDGDGDIGTADKARLNSYTLDNLPLTGAYLLACDLDGDGEVGTADKARLNAYTLDTLDIYAGLTLRPTAQTSAQASQTSSVETLANADESAFVECDTAQTSAQISVISSQDLSVEISTANSFNESVFATSTHESATTSVNAIAAEECSISVDTTANAIAETSTAAIGQNATLSRCPKISIKWVEQAVITLNSITERTFCKKSCHNWDIN